jgi:hypothetical protein
MEYAEDKRPVALIAVKTRETSVGTVTGYGLAAWGSNPNRCNYCLDGTEYYLLIQSPPVVQQFVGNAEVHTSFKRGFQ